MLIYPQVPSLNYVKISSVTLGSDTAQVDFTGLLSKYSEFLLVIEDVISNNTTTDRLLRIRLNDDSTSNYYTNTMTTGTFIWSGSASTSIQIGSGSGYESISRNNTGYHKGWAEIKFSNSTTNDKAISGFGSSGKTNTGYIFQSQWRNNTDKITKISLLLDSNSFLSGSKFTLYGRVGT